MGQKSKKLDDGQKNLLRLIAKEQECPEGWAPVSKPVYPLVDAMPKELVELHPVGDDGRGRARLTQQGQSVIYAMKWI